MKRLMATICLCVLFFAGTALADWNIGDPAKWVQLPDPTGWDVQANDPELADDWLCTGTGPVSDIHIWYSVFGDEYSAILQGGVVRIYSDSPDPDGTGPLFSHPNELKWEWIFGPDDFTSRLDGLGPQGWYNPRNQEVYLPNHNNYYQLNLIDIPNPFEQQEGEVYWLALQLNATFAMGWKTSLDHWNDDATYRSSTTGDWQELRDPYTGESLDMAFVITPEPATICLLGLGIFSLLHRKR